MEGNEVVSLPTDLVRKGAEQRGPHRRPGLAGFPHDTTGRLAVRRKLPHVDLTLGVSEARLSSLQSDVLVLCTWVHRASSGLRCAKADTLPTRTPLARYRGRCFHAAWGCLQGHMQSRTSHNGPGGSGAVHAQGPQTGG